MSSSAIASLRSRIDPQRLSKVTVDSSIQALPQGDQYTSSFRKMCCPVNIKTYPNKQRFLNFMYVSGRCFYPEDRCFASGYVAAALRAGSRQAHSIEIV